MFVVNRQRGPTHIILLIVSRKQHKSRTPTRRSFGTDDLGRRLRLARDSKGVTVRGLARQIDVSPSLVSQIERGRVMPSVGTLFAIVTALDLFVDDLFRGGDRRAKPHADAAAPRAKATPVQRPHNRKAIRLAKGVRWERLTPTSDQDAEFMYLVYDVGAASCQVDSLIRHGGKEYGFIISGRLGVRIGFDEFELHPGYSLSFDAQTPHRLWTIGKKPVAAVWVVLNRHGDARSPRAASSS